MAAPNIRGGIIEYHAPGEHFTVTVGAVAVLGGQVVKLSGNRTVVPTTGVADVPAGIALYDGAIGEKVTIVTEGVWPVKAGAAVAAGDLLGPAATAGTVQPIGAGTFGVVVGQAMEAISNGATGRVRLKI